MKNVLRSAAVVVVALLATPVPASAVEVGETAPGFELRYATRDSVAGAPLSLASLLGQSNVVLAFYPADWSGGCTKEVCTLRDNFAALAALEAEIVGISGDYVYSHHAWAKHHDLPFRLASDHDHAVAKLYGSFNAGSGYNRRTVFVIDRGGSLAYRDLDYSVRDSVSFTKLREALARLK